MDNKRDVEQKELEEAKKKASEIIKEAEDCAREIHSASLLYVDEMLEQITLATKSAKQSIEIIMNQAVDDLNQKMKRIEENKLEILKDLRELSEDGTIPIRKVNYEIKVSDEWKNQVDHMFDEPSIPYEKETVENETMELEEEDDRFKATDFDLDNEYFTWLEEKEK